VLIDHLHRLHFTVARLTENSRTDVRPVIEVYVVGQPMNAPPLQRLAGIIDGRKLFDIRAVQLCHSMAVHALFDRRNAGQARFESARVTIKTGDLKETGVKLMRIGNWLRRLISSHKA
jgi:hypothetical protein